MNRPAPALLQPRKSPRQARSAVTIEAIHTATIQILLADGVGRLSTTRVAERAGVSVGTMYQYYPHKQALLFAIVERQLDAILAAMMTAIERLHGRGLTQVAEGLTVAWLDIKTADDVASRAIYGISAEFDMVEPISRATERLVAAIAGLLEAAPDARFADVRSVAFMVTALLGGSVRSVLEGTASQADLARLRRELPVACRAYLNAANEAARHGA